jgi:hypothetical protein
VTDRSSSGTALAYRLEHPKYGIELSINPPDGDWAARGWTVTPLYAGVAQGGIAPLYARYIEVLAHLQTAWGDNGGNAKINSEMLLVLEEAGRLVSSTNREG